LLAGVLTACPPTFAAQSSTVSISNAAFVPVSCQMVVGATAVELTSADGARLRLLLPPQTLKAFEEVKGQAEVTYSPGAGKPEVALGACATLSLTGEGYHAQQKRAAKGHAELACPAPTTISGALAFSGCF
jgi:hypothetical protein